jgi:hypothetical protein
MTLRPLAVLNPWAKMKHKTTQALYAYWNEVRGERLAPRRFEIEPSQIVSILPNTFILERTGSNAYRYRLAGTAICEMFGQEYRDTNFLDHWPSDDHDTLLRLLESVTRRGGAGLAEFDASGTAKQTLSFEAVFLPLLHTRDTIDRILGSVTPLTSPDWLGSQPLNARRLLASSIVWPDGRPTHPTDAMLRQMPFLPHIRKARIVRSERRQFRVYDGGLTKGRDE